jgi:hypothetical protein
MDNDRTEILPVTLPNGTLMYVEARSMGGKEKVSFKNLPFDDVMAAITGLGEGINTALQTVKPKKVSVKLGLEVGLEAGKLTALLVKGTGKANLEITLHWEN